MQKHLEKPSGHTKLCYRRDSTSGWTGSTFIETYQSLLVVSSSIVLDLPASGQRASASEEQRSSNCCRAFGTAYRQPWRCSRRPRDDHRFSGEEIVS
jgi:hypothetical protein